MKKESLIKGGQNRTEEELEGSALGFAIALIGALIVILFF